MSTIDRFFDDNCGYKPKHSVYIMPKIISIASNNTFKFLLFGKSNSGDCYTWIFCINNELKINEVKELWRKSYGTSF